MISQNFTDSFAKNEEKTFFEKKKSKNLSKNAKNENFFIYNTTYYQMKKKGKWVNFHLGKQKSIFEGINDSFCHANLSVKRQRLLFFLHNSLISIEKLTRVCKATDSEIRPILLRKFKKSLKVLIDNSWQKI